jgi:rare lipoprotein A
MATSFSAGQTPFCQALQRLSVQDGNIYAFVGRLLRYYQRPRASIMQTNYRRRWRGFVCGATCLLLPLAALPPMDGQFTTVASWYGPGFQGRKTASGERFDQNQLTAASRTLPFGTNVLVKNIRNGRTCNVVINDRGPYVKGRGIDLSHAAARRLGIGGIAPVVCYTGETEHRFAPRTRINDDASDDAIAYASALQRPTKAWQAPDLAQIRQTTSFAANRSPALGWHAQHGAMATHIRPAPNFARRRYYSAEAPRYIAFRSGHKRASHYFDRSRQFVAYRRPQGSKVERTLDRWTYKVAHLYKAFKGSVLAVL